LASELTRRGHTVAIASGRVGGELAARTLDRGISVYPFEECPPDWAPDILHVQELVPSCFAAAMYCRAPAVASVHSEWDCERPFLSERIWRYICIRPSVQHAIIDRDRVAPERTVVIRNGFDVPRFAVLRDSAAARPPDEQRVLFVGTIDPLRQRAIQDMIARGAREGFRVRVVGDKHADYLDEPQTHVEVYPSTWDVERHLAEASATAGILLGRTTVEGWLAGLPGWIYDIDLDGSVKSLELFAPPADLSMFGIATVTDSIMELYEGAISSGYMRDPSVSIDSLGVASALSISELVKVGNDLADLRANVAALRAKMAVLRAVYVGFRRMNEALRKLRRGTRGCFR
jgi:glycosyltransferase involved in cell wall biosynthesis